MSGELNWTERVNRLTANTVHEALAKLIEEARVAIGISHDALEERVTALDERLVEAQATLSAALGGARETIDAGMRAALDEIPALIARARAEAESRASLEVGSTVTEMRSVFAESMERVQQQFAVQSDLLLEEVTSLVSSVDKRLDEMTNEVSELKRALEAARERAEVEPATAEEPGPAVANDEMEEASAEEPPVTEPHDEQPAPAAPPIEPYRFTLPAGAPTEPAFTISLVDDDVEASDETRSIWS